MQVPRSDGKKNKKRSGRKVQKSNANRLLWTAVRAQQEQQQEQLANARAAILWEQQEQHSQQEQQRDPRLLAFSSVSVEGRALQHAVELPTIGDNDTYHEEHVREHESHLAPSESKLEQAEAELSRWRRGELRLVSEVINVDEGSVEANQVCVDAVGVEASANKRRRVRIESSSRSEPSGAVSSTMAMLVQVKKEKVEAQEEGEEHEENLRNQTLYTDFLQTKLDQMKDLARAAGADPRTIQLIVEQQWRS